MIELKSCPFCGSNNVSLRAGYLICGAVHCDSCGADVTFAMEKGDEDNWRNIVTARWNNWKERKSK